MHLVHTVGLVTGWGRGMAAAQLPQSLHGDPVTIVYSTAIVRAGEQ